MPQSRRSKSGNMLVMVAATAILLVCCLLFGLQYLSVNRGHMEQRTAAEAAALAAAQGIGKIAVNTSEFGWVGLSAVGPVAQTTLAGDQWYCEVKSINEIIGTARLDYIIACQLNDPFLKALALQDQQKAISASNQLITAIQGSLVSGGKATDVYGNAVTPYSDAQTAYMNNNAKQSTYVAGSLKLSLGTLVGGVGTAIPVPNPNSLAQLNPSQMVGSNYLSDMDLSYNGQDFYLASSGTQVALADATKWQAASGSQIPAVVKIDADNQFTNQGQTYTQHFIACALPGSDVKRPACGALTISFPDGPPPEIASPQDLFNWTQLQTTNCDVLTSAGGDYPYTPPAQISSTLPSAWSPIPWPGGGQNVSNICKLGLYDWLREAGSGVNISSVPTMLSSKLNTPSPATTLWIGPDPFTSQPVTIGLIPTGIAHIYTFNPNGTILYRSKTVKPYPFMIAAENQLYAESSGQTAGGILSSVAPWKYTASMNIPPLNGHGNGNNSTGGSGSNSSAVSSNGNGPQGSGGQGNSSFGHSHSQGNNSGGSNGPGPGGGGPQGPPPGNGGGQGPYTSSPQAVQIAGLQQYDFYMRDMVHQQGTLGGGIHSGEPMDDALVATKTPKNRLNQMARNSDEDYEIGGGSSPNASSGTGVPPIVTRQDDFATTSPPPVKPGITMYYNYVWGPDPSTGSYSRPTYVTNGTSVDIRFRRQINIGLLSQLFGGYNTGYVGEMD